MPAGVGNANSGDARYRYLPPAMSQHQPSSRPDESKKVVVTSLPANCRTTARPKCVSFNPYDTIHEIRSRKDYTTQELHASWYDTIQVSCMRGIARAEAELFESGDLIQNEGVAVRGLEQITKEGSERRKEIRMKSYGVVLMACPIFNEEAINAGAINSEAVGEAYSNYSKPFAMEAQRIGINDEIEAIQKKAEEDNSLSVPSEKSGTSGKKISVGKSVDDVIVYGSDKVDGENFGIHRYQKSMKCLVWPKASGYDEEETTLFIYDLFQTHWGVRFLKKSEGRKECVELSESEAKKKIRDDAMEYWIAKQELSRDYLKRIVVDGQRLWTDFMNDDYFNITPKYMEVRQVKPLQFSVGIGYHKTRNVHLPRQLDGAILGHSLNDKYLNKYHNNTEYPGSSIEHLPHQFSAFNTFADDTENCVSICESSQVDSFADRSISLRESSQVDSFAERSMSICESSVDESFTDTSFHSNFSKIYGSSADESFTDTSFHSTLSTDEVGSLVAKNKRLSWNTPEVVRGSDIPENDIKLGRGRTLQSHPGNIWFQNLIAEYFDEYDALERRREKTKMTKKIVGIIKSKSRRFWKQCGWNNLWEEVDLDTDEALNKVSFTFRTVRRKRKKKVENIKISQQDQDLPDDVLYSVLRSPSPTGTRSSQADKLVKLFEEKEKIRAEIAKVIDESKKLEVQLVTTQKSQTSLQRKPSPKRERSPAAAGRESPTLRIRKPSPKRERSPAAAGRESPTPRIRNQKMCIDRSKLVKLNESKTPV